MHWTLPLFITSCRLPCRPLSARVPSALGQSKAPHYLHSTIYQRRSHLSPVPVVDGQQAEYSLLEWRRNWKHFESTITNADWENIAQQLGHKPWNAMSVEARTEDGLPAVLKCYPLLATKKGPEPFPTTFWLCDPRFKAKISALEYKGWIEAFKRKIEGNPTYGQEMARCHEAYAAERWSLLREGDRSMLRLLGWDGKLRDSGIGGMNRDGFVKCLHIHYAHYLARPQDNMIGAWVQELFDAT